LANFGLSLKNLYPITPQITTTTTPYVLVKKKPDQEEEDRTPILVIGPNSEISFKNVDDNDHQIPLDPDPVLETWTQGNYLHYVHGSKLTK
jgi:hypothetical protein